MSWPFFQETRLNFKEQMARAKTCTACKYNTRFGLQRGLNDATVKSIIAVLELERLFLRAKTLQQLNVEENTGRLMRCIKQRGGYVSRSRWTASHPHHLSW